MLVTQWAFVIPLHLESIITSPDRVLTVVETTMLAVMLLHLAWKISRGWIGFRRGDDTLLWHAISQCGFHDVRHLSSFSGMRLLHYALPKVLSNHTKRKWTSLKQEDESRLGPLVRFFFGSLVCL